MKQFYQVKIKLQLRSKRVPTKDEIRDFINDHLSQSTVTINAKTGVQTELQTLKVTFPPQLKKQKRVKITRG